MEKIGKRIKKIRNLLNKSQDDLAKDLEVTKQAISNIENSKSLPSINFLYKLSSKFDVNLNFIILGEGKYFVSTEKTYANLRKMLISEVENLLDSRGIK